MAVDNWNTNPDLNTSIEGIDIAEGCQPAGLNDFGRKVCAAVKGFFDKAYRKNENVKFTPSGDPDPFSTHADGDIWIEYTP